jgi:hypothetical protein
MGNLIPWSQIHPSIKSEGPFVAVVIVDPQRQLCVSEMVEFDPELIADVNQAVPEVVAAAQAAAARVVSGYRSGRRAVAEPAPATTTYQGLRVLAGGKR